MKRIGMLLMITIFVIVIGLSLRSMLLYRPFSNNEGFMNDTTLQRSGESGDMTGYVSMSNGDQSNVYKPSSGPYPSQIANVPTADEYIIGRIQRFQSHVPLLHSDKDYVLGTMDREIVNKFARGDIPNIILNPDSHTSDQITCDIEQDCDEFVRNSKLYCPVGMDRLKNQESTGEPNEQKYQGCYSITRDYPSLACRFGGRFNYCDYLTDLRIQRVGRGFYVFPTYDAMYEAYSRASTSNEKKRLSYILFTKIHMIRVMILTFDHEDVRNHTSDIQKWYPWTTTGSPLLDQYGRSVFYDTFLLYQSGTHKSPTRIGFVLRKDTPVHGITKSYVPELSTPVTRHSYNLKHIGYVHDTTQDPMPILQPMYNERSDTIQGPLTSD
jgi:hypothetical protein